MVNRTTSEILTMIGASPKHAGKADALLVGENTEPFHDALQTLCRANKTHSDGAIFGLVGRRGVGKTQCGVCMMGHWYTNRIGSVRYLRFAELCMYFRDAMKQGREIENLHTLSAPSLLVIDEMDKRADTDHERRTLNTMLDGRYGLGRWTLLIGNDTSDGLMNAIGPTIGSRMRESGGVRELNGPNYREATHG